MFDAVSKFEVKDDDLLRIDFDECSLDLIVSGPFQVSRNAQLCD